MSLMGRVACCGIKGMSLCHDCPDQPFSPEGPAGGLPSITSAQRSRLDAEAVVRLFTTYRLRYGTEVQLQDAIEEALRAEKIAFERELILSPRERIDFLCGSIGIEVKINESMSQALRQAHRYLSDTRLSALALVGTKAWLARLPRELLGKPLYGVQIKASLL